MMQKPLFLLALLTLSPHAAADIYRCPDSTGKVKFQDKPCQGTSKNDNKVVEAKPVNRWPVATKGAAIALCRHEVTKLLGVSEEQVPELSPILSSCNCIFDQLEKQYSAEYFMAHQDEVKASIDKLMKGTCAPHRK